MPDSPVIDLHQHLWPEQLIEELRRRCHPPYLRGWRLWTDGEPPYDLRPSDHDPVVRTRRDLDSGVDVACVSLSAPLGIEALPSGEAERLLEAWHEGASAMPRHFLGWASVHVREPDLTLLDGLLATDFVGVQVPATELLTPDAWLRAGNVLSAAERAGKPVLVHPGPVGTVPDGIGWWAPVVGYVAQLQAAWWSWHAVVGRSHFPRLRLVFAAGAGLAPLQHERFVGRGGAAGPVDPDVFVDSSSYGLQGLDALVRVLGLDAIVLGSDAPYGTRSVDVLGAAAARRICSDNPQRALGRVLRREDAA
jgi:predicted TIM-barrel fold metal-dependent hydrolase